MSTLHPTEQTTSGELSERHAGLICADHRVRVAEDGRGYEDDGARRELDDEFEIPEHQMSASVVVVLAKRHDTTPACRIVHVVGVNARDGLWPKIEAGRGENGLGEVVLEGRVLILELELGVLIVRVHVRGKEFESI